MIYGGGSNNIDASKLLYRRFQHKKMNNYLVFFRQDQDFYNLVVRDEIDICIFCISCLEKKSRISRRRREITKGFPVVERQLSLLNLMRFFEIEKSCHALGQIRQDARDVWDKIPTLKSAKNLANL